MGKGRGRGREGERERGREGEGQSRADAGEGPLQSGGEEVVRRMSPGMVGWRREVGGEREVHQLADSWIVRSFGPLG